MTANEAVKMIVFWKRQRRPVVIKQNYDVSAIEQTIRNAFQLQNVQIYDEYQIQYYDVDSQCFMDLFVDTLPVFQENIERRLSNEARSTQTKERRLRIVPKAVRPTRT